MSKRYLSIMAILVIALCACATKKTARNGEYCSSNTICQDSLSCYESVCTAISTKMCNKNSECDAGQICDTKICVPGSVESNTDIDGDIIADEDDNCPEDANAEQADEDGDGVGDVCDNCPSDANKEQADTDKNDIGDACEDDPPPTGIILLDATFDIDCSSMDNTRPIQATGPSSIKWTFEPALPTWITQTVKGDKITLRVGTTDFDTCNALQDTTYQMTATDTNDPTKKATATLTIEKLPLKTLAFTTTSLTAYYNTPYTLQLNDKATGGSGDYVWELLTKDPKKWVPCDHDGEFCGRIEGLPVGLTWSNGTITGTTTDIGKSIIEVQLTDAKIGGVPIVQKLELTVLDQDGFPVRAFIRNAAGAETEVLQNTDTVIEFGSKLIMKLESADAGWYLFYKDGYVFGNSAANAGQDHSIGFLFDCFKDPAKQKPGSQCWSPYKVMEPSVTKEASLRLASPHSLATGEDQIIDPFKVNIKDKAGTVKDFSFGQITVKGDPCGFKISASRTDSTAGTTGTTATDGTTGTSASEPLKIGDLIGLNFKAADGIENPTWQIERRYVRASDSGCGPTGFVKSWSCGASTDGTCPIDEYLAYKFSDACRDERMGQDGFTLKNTITVKATGTAKDAALLCPNGMKGATVYAFDVKVPNPNKDEVTSPLLADIEFDGAPENVEGIVVQLFKSKSDNPDQVIAETERFVLGTELAAGFQFQTVEGGDFKNEVEADFVTASIDNINDFGDDSINLKEAKLVKVRFKVTGTDEKKAIAYQLKHLKIVSPSFVAWPEKTTYKDAKKIDEASDWHPVTFELQWRLRKSGATDKE